MLIRMWPTPPCMNRYVNGCHTWSPVSVRAGVRPSSSPRRSRMPAGASEVSRNTPTFAQISHLTAGVMRPGPKE